ncbi:MAG: histidine phosphatase family protein [Acidobacteria bacterium]|nr:histidine phosphatase family protein [Acidobacteriota bacterium]QQS33951.1 MAG: histidine phosphatase family protein [Acidobacteriota bacterium]
MPPPTRLYLIRHGQSAGNAQGRFGGHGTTPLSELGVAQAEATAKALAKEKIDAIFSSDLLRAIQTAEPLAREIGVEVRTSPAFRERHVGVLEGLTFDESRERHPKDYYALVNRNVHHVITGGESYRQLLLRITSELDSIVSEHRGRRIAIFSHTGAICFLTLHLLGAIHRNTKQTPWLITSNCGINRFEFRGPRNVRVLALNDTRHLSSITGNDSFAAK